MTPFDLTPQARRDFYEIIDFLAERNPSAARRWDDECVSEFLNIASMPLLSAVRPEFAPAPVRVRVFGNHLIFFDPERSPLLILRIVHARRNVSELTFEIEKRVP